MISLTCHLCQFFLTPKFSTALPSCSKSQQQPKFQSPTMKNTLLPRAMFITSILLLTAAAATVESLNFSFPTFESSSDLILHNSYIVLGSLQVTPALAGSPLTNLSGRALYRNPVRLWGTRSGREGRIRASFNSTFVINISRKSKKKAGEGMAFILTADSSLPGNSQGKWLGVTNETIDGKPEARVVALEFDTRKDSELGDLDDNHIGLDVNRVESMRQVSLDRVVDLSEGDDVRVVVVYDGTNLTVFVTEKLMMSERIDLSEYLPKSVFVGFSGSTGKYTELNTVKSWEFYSSEVVDERSGPSGLLYISILVPIGLVILGGIIAGFCYWKRRRSDEEVEEEEAALKKMIQRSSIAPRVFKLKQLKIATGNFDPRNELGRGGFGVVFRGIIPKTENEGNQVVAIKRFTSQSSQGKQEFVAEVTTIGSLHHKNLVKLIGWCHEGTEFLLVYEYMTNGSLDRLIFTRQGGEDGLSWGRRLSIIHGVAHALDYLHNGCEKRVLHRDIKASNILLDSDFNPKLGDFGLARTIRQSEQTHHSTKEIAGTPGYMAPECFLTGQATTETDIYAFGILLLGVVCGRKPGNPMMDDRDGLGNGIVGWVWELYRNGRLTEGVDSRIRNKESELLAEEEDFVTVLILGLACCHPNPRQRPSMKTVLQVLSGESSPPVIPPERPAFMWPAAVLSESESSVSGSQGTPSQFVQVAGR